MLLYIDNICPRGVLMTLIVLLQATSFIHSSLLLRCGDIESNPGPGIYLGKVYAGSEYTHYNYANVIL
jgi:mannitol-specific phosphotransferase system IIBC component